MKKRNLVLAAAMLLLASVATAHQKLSDGSDKGGISANAILEFSSTNKGLLHSRVSLIQTTDATPLFSCGVGDGIPVHANAILELFSKNKGLLDMLV